MSVVQETDSQRVVGYYCFDMFLLHMFVVLIMWIHVVYLILPQYH